MLVTMGQSLFHIKYVERIFNYFPAGGLVVKGGNINYVYKPSGGFLVQGSGN